MSESYHPHRQYSQTRPDYRQQYGVYSRVAESEPPRDLSRRQSSNSEQALLSQSQSQLQPQPQPQPQAQPQPQPQPQPQALTQASRHSDSNRPMYYQAMNEHANRPYYGTRHTHNTSLSMRYSGQVSGKMEQYSQAPHPTAQLPSIGPTRHDSRGFYPPFTSSYPYSAPPRIDHTGMRMSRTMFQAGGRMLTAEEKEIKRKVSHSAIEKRRRERTNAVLRELQSIVPGLCKPGKIQKLEILEAAADYIRQLSSANNDGGRDKTVSTPTSTSSVTANDDQNDDPQDPASMKVNFLLC